MTIEKIVSPAGIEAWLVREQPCRWSRSTYAFHGGSSQDEPDKSGIASLAADLLDEGAGDLDGKTFHERLENHAIELGFSVGARLFPRLAAHAQRASRRGFRPAAAGADARRASTPTRSSACAARCCRRCGATPPSPNDSPAGAGGDRVSRTILTAAESHRHAGNSAAHHRRRSARLCAAGIRAQRAQDRDRRRHRRRRPPAR